VLKLPVLLPQRFFRTLTNPSLVPKCLYCIAFRAFSEVIFTELRNYHILNPRFEVFTAVKVQIVDFRVLKRANW
jgi:hypothetical protein